MTDTAHAIVTVAHERPTQISKRAHTPGWRCLKSSTGFGSTALHTSRGAPPQAVRRPIRLHRQIHPPLARVRVLSGRPRSLKP
jgi:hypothetical protein